MSLPRTSRRRRSVIAAVTLGIGALVLAGCSASPKTEASSAPVTASDADAFPATVEHIYGKTVIPEEPKRVVTIGWSTQDAVAALGVVPVAVPVSAWGGDADDNLPWFSDKIRELGGEMPEHLNEGSGGEIDFEQMLSLDPDVILAPYSGVTETDYERLSTIAPTVAYKQTAWTGDWEEITETVGKALGRNKEAARQIEATKATISAQAKAHPEFAGTTFTYGVTLSEDSADLGIYSERDPRVRMLQQLGLEIAPRVSELTQADGEFNQAVSLEEVDTIETDIFLAWGSEKVDIERTLTNPLMARWAPVANGKALIFDDRSLVMATTATSTLSIPWSLDKFVPQLSALITGSN